MKDSIGNFLLRLTDIIFNIFSKKEEVFEECEMVMVDGREGVIVFVYGNRSNMYEVEFVSNTGRSTVKTVEYKSGNIKKIK